MVDTHSTGNFSNDVTRDMINILCSQKNGLKVCHINAQSLNNKIDEFRFNFENSKADIVCVSETWLRSTTPDSLVSLNGFKTFRADRLRQSHGGGIAIFVKDTIMCKFILKSDSDDLVEYLFLEILSNGNKSLIGCVYRPDRRINLTNFYNKLESVAAYYTNIVIAGDFNSNLFTETHLTDNMTSLGLSATNTRTPTHFTDSSSTLLDLFFVSDSSKVLLYDQLSASCFSKHDLIFLIYDFRMQETTNTFSYRDFKNLDYYVLEQEISHVDWNSVYHMATVDEKLNFLDNSILNIFDTTVPLKTKTISHKTRPWFTEAIKTAIQQRNLAFACWKRFKTPELRIEYCNERKNVNCLIRRAKSEYYSSRFSSAIETKQKWKTIREIGIATDVRNQDQQIDSDELNEKFVSLPNLEVNQSFYNFTPSNTYSSENCFEFSTVTQLDVIFAFKSINSNAIGFDNIHPKFLKIILPHLIPYITHLLNTIIISCCFPTKWKHAKVLPIPKPNNEYRPISILPFLSKVLEKLLHKQMINYINDKKLLSNYQSGFRTSHSCTTTLLDVAENVRREVDVGRVIFLILLDHSKAFDTVDHRLLCKKLKHFFHFSTTAISLLESYLTNRTQSVFTKLSTSSSLSVNKGVPQGSILGPLLFAIYINDLPSQLHHSKLQMYADDAQFYLSTPLSEIEQCVRTLNTELNRIHLWASANGLSINPKKSKCLIIHKKTLKLNFSGKILIDNKPIEIVNSTKNLGVTFNNTLTWSNHVNVVCGQIYAKLRILWATQHCTPFHIRTLLAKSYLMPNLLYGCELFSQTDAASTRKLNVAYNGIIRYVHGLRKYDRLGGLSTSLYGVSLDNLFKIKLLLQLHKIVYLETPIYLFEKLKFTRSNRGKRIIPFLYCSLMSQYQFYINVVRLWNSLPFTQQLNSNAKEFRKYIFQQYSLQNIT